MAESRFLSLPEKYMVLAGLGLRAAVIEGELRVVIMNEGAFGDDPRIGSLSRQLADVKALIVDIAANEITLGVDE